MKIPFLASFIIFIIWLTYEISKSRKQGETEDISFWAKEAKANQTRRKSLENLNYIKIPFDSLPMHTLIGDEQITDYHQMLFSLADSPIVNFSGISNTDLKLAYGAPNINLLMQYDESYTNLASTLQRWASLLYESGYTQDAKAVLEFAISTDTDVSGTYRLLASIYAEEGQPDKIAELVQTARQLTSGSKDIIVRILQEFDP